MVLQSWTEEPEAPAFMEAHKPLFYWKIKLYKLTKCWVENDFLCPAKWLRDQKALSIFKQVRDLLGFTN